MKDQILKIAKVKSEKDFYKKFPTEEAFMAKHGKALKKAAMGKSMVNKQLHQLTDFGNPPIAQVGATTPPKFEFTKPESFGAGAETAGMSALQNVDKIIGGIEAIGQQKKAIKKADQSSQLSGLANQAAFTREKVDRKYVRPEDALVQPGQLGNPYGSGTDYLAAQNGTMIGGNPTEIQNTYAPTGDLYQDLEYEPLTNQNLKQYKKGGRMPKAEFGEYFQDSGQAQIGSAVGESIGSAFGPAGAMVGKYAGKVLGNLAGGIKDARKLQKYQDETAMNTQQAAWQNQLQSGQFSKSMKDGGYMNPEYNPQVIAKFGDYSMDQLLAPPYDADMLRAGGSIGSGYYTPPSAEAMYTGRAQNGTMLDSYIRSKEDLQSITDNGRYNENLRSATSSTDRYADGRPVEKTDIYSMTKGQGDNQRVKEFLRSQTGDDAPQYSMQKSYKPLFSDQYKTVSREIGAGRGERRMADMQNFLNEGKMEHGGQMAMGGELEVGDGGRLETMSYNPNLPGGEIAMFRGASHDNGGIKTKYGENEVEVEGGEPAVKLQEGGSAENLVVFGNIKINKEIADLMGDPKAKGMKFKTYIADIAKNDAKQLKRINKGLELIDQYDGNSSYDKLGMNSGIAGVMGGKAQQKINAEKIKEASIVQDAIHQTARQLGAKSDRLAEGKIEKETDPSMVAKNGKKAQKGIVSETGMDYSDIDFDYTLPEASVTSSRKIAASQAPASYRQGYRPGDSVIGGVDIFGNYTGPKEPFATKKRFDWNKAGSIGAAVLSNLEPYLRPTNANQPLPPDQLYPEYFALATNQLDPVQAQTFQPTLDTPYDISLNDQINAVDSQARAAIRAAGSNPAAQAQIMSQALEAKNRILGEQSRINQTNKMQTYAKNRDVLNDAQLKNLQILDQQYVRQAQAKSNTKEQAFSALSSIAAKTAQQRALNKKLAILENTYNFRFSPSGRAINMNGPAQFNLSGNMNQAGSFRTDAYGNQMYPIYNPKTGKIKGYSVAESSGPSADEIDDVFNLKNGGKTSKTKARNSSIVKALKNL